MAKLWQIETNKYLKYKFEIQIFLMPKHSYTKEIFLTLLKNDLFFYKIIFKNLYRKIVTIHIIINLQLKNTF